MPLGKRTDCGDARFSGIEVPFDCDVSDSLESVLTCGFDFIVAPLVHPQYKKPSARTLPPGVLQPPFTRADLLLISGQWSNQVVGKVSPWICPDSPEEPLQTDSVNTLRQELEWAAHLSLQACLLPTPTQLVGAAKYARTLNQVIRGLSNMALWLRVPMMPPSARAESEREARRGQCSDVSTSGRVEMGGWEWWNQVRCLCEHSSRLGCVLDVPGVLPGPKEMARWRGEPVKALLISTSVFVMNKRGYPTLSKPHQAFVAEFFAQGVQVILSGPPHPATLALSAAFPSADAGQKVVLSGNEPVPVPEGHPMKVYWEYLSYLFRRQDPASPQEQLEMAYRDYLQAPLQPLQDNLEYQTYETFEKDATKYNTYQAAVHAALLDRVPAARAADVETVIMVVGAGRGPLVRASLAAAAASQRRVRVYAVEKNPNAVVSLQNLILSEGWTEYVTVVPADMRAWEAPELADILVSELLGSFGDNELSPECLDGAQRFLKPGGISIPASYTSYLQPVTSAKLWNDVKVYDDLEHFETPYVVKLHRFTALAETQPIFTFSHPNPAQHIDNSRSCSVTFERDGMPAAICHGFAGYFDAKLYGDVHLSTHPPTHTPSMFSWFPIYFPIREPMYLPESTPIQVHMWRSGAHYKVWYEWAVTEPSVTPLHNPGGRSYYVGL